MDNKKIDGYKGGFIKPIGDVINKDDSSMYDDILIEASYEPNDSESLRMEKIYNQRLKLKESIK